MIRFNSAPLSNLAIIVELNLISYTLSFVSIINFPGGITKFSIRYDPITCAYLTFCNPVTVPEHPAQRNILSLLYTRDLEKLSEWHVYYMMTLVFLSMIVFVILDFIILIGILIHYHHLYTMQVVLNEIVMMDPI